jgi:hypothetical protein
MLGIPTHPRLNPENLSPAKILPAARAISNIPIPTDSIWPRLALLRIGVPRCSTSSKARIRRLNRQLPKRVPKARSGSLTRATALTPVASSGIEVTIAKSTRPIHSLPRPVFSAIASPYRASFVPANRMITRHRINFNQTKDWGSYSHLGGVYSLYHNIVSNWRLGRFAPFYFTSICSRITTEERCPAL